MCAWPGCGAAGVSDQWEICGAGEWLGEGVKEWNE